MQYQDSPRYKMCPFDHCSQRPKHGGSETRLVFFDSTLSSFFYKGPSLNSSLQLYRLGSWGSWEGGEGPLKYSVMKYTGGQVSGLGQWY